MAITSYGYDGTVDEVEFARALSLAGGVSYGITGTGDFAPSSGGAGDRAVTIAAGEAVGGGVRVVNSAPIVKNLASVSSGSRWDLIVLRRNWSTNLATIEVITGSATKQLPVRSSTIGVQDDQPLALVRVVAGSAVVADIVDLRVWVSDGGAFAKDELVLTFMNRIGSQVQIGNDLWVRVLDVTNVPTWMRFGLEDTVGAVTLNPTLGPHSGHQPLTLTRRGTRARLRGVVTVVGVTDFGAGIAYILADIPSGWRPAGGKAAFLPVALSPFTAGAGWVKAAPDGKVTFAVSQASTQFPGLWAMGVDIEWDLV